VIATRPIESIDADVVVVGGGGAGLRAAYDAAASSARTVLVLKGRLTASGATAFGVAELAGFSVPDGAGDPLDSPDVHFEDIMRVGQGCNDARLVRVLVDEAESALTDLERWGIEFVIDPKTGKPLVAMGDFASRPRNRKIYHHGKPITVALKREVEKLGVTTVERTAVLGLLRGEGGIDGVLGLRADGRLVRVNAGATVLATGGAGQLFDLSLMPPDITGDGYAFGYRAGAELVNMEFMQAGFGTIKPALNMIMTWLWAFNPKFVDRDGRALLTGVLPGGVTSAQVMKAKVKHYPFSTSDDSKWLEIAAKLAMNEGRASEAGGFTLDLRGVDEGVLPADSDLAVMWPITKQWFAKKRVDVVNAPLEVGLFGHAVNGGLVISEHCETSIPGLFAVGETAGGPYGADRLGGNMLLNTQVFGKRAGRRAAEVGRARAGVANRAALPAINTLVCAGGDMPAKEALKRVKKAMTRDVLIIRNERGLVRAQAELDALRADIEDKRFGAGNAIAIIDLSEAMNLLDVGTVMIAAARLRKETRGSHYRDDFPEKDPEWSRPIFVRRLCERAHADAARFEEVMA
jgi:fumarate reductase (CoM/CoB) subunit A